MYTVDGIVVQASGPGTEKIHGYMDNIELFGIITEVLSLEQLRH